MGQIVEFNELDEATKELIRAGQKVRANAYAPFSNFFVGAAIRTNQSSNSIVTGCNVENSSYGGTICAERTAATSAVRDGFRNILEVAVCADWVDGAPTTPCGICRQFLFEFGPKAQIYCADSELQKVLITSMDELLPYGFRLNASNKQ